MSDSLQPHGLQHTRPPCPSPTSRACSNSCPLSQWCHPAILSSVLPFSSCPQSLPASGSFPMSQLFAWGGQSIGVSASASVLPMNTKDWSPLGWTGWVSLQPKGLSRVFSSITVQKHQFFDAQLSLWSNSTELHFFKIFFWCGPFLKSLNLLQYCFWFLFWFFGCEACGILAPQLEMEPASPALEGKVLATEPLGKSQYWLILLIKVTNILIYTDIKWVFVDAIKVRVNIILAWCGPYIQWKLWAFLFL